MILKTVRLGEEVNKRASHLPWLLLSSVCIQVYVPYSNSIIIDNIYIFVVERKLYKLYIKDNVYGVQWKDRSNIGD